MKYKIIVQTLAPELHTTAQYYDTVYAGYNPIKAMLMLLRNKVLGGETRCVILKG